jgi:hypothetical protein
MVGMVVLTVVSMSRYQFLRRYPTRGSFVVPAQNQIAVSCKAVNIKIRLFYLKPGICILAGKQTPTGQTALKKEVVLSKLDFKFSAHSDKHQSDDLGRRQA